MDTICNFGDTLTILPRRYTQFLFDYKSQKSSIIFSEHNYFTAYNITNNDARTLTLKYNKYAVTCYVLSNDTNSLEVKSDNFVEYIYNYFTCKEENRGCSIFDTLLRLYNISFLGILEHNQNNGWHIHLLIFHKTSFANNKDRVKVDNDIHYLFARNTFDNINLKLDHQQVRSVASYLNYLKKDPYVLFSDNTETLKMYIHFDKNFIFDPSTYPKFTHSVKYSNNNDVLMFFLRKLKEGALDFEDALKEDDARGVLGNPQARCIFNNAQTHFMSNRKFSDSIHEIVQKFIKYPNQKKCICPIIEFLKYQNVNYHTFEYAFVQWLKCNSKKNTLIFFGPPDTGKSIFASTLHSCFRFANRLTQDGIFTFANAVNADVIYHEEPFITAETIQTAKLVYEGDPRTCVAVKNQSSKRLNKKIPCLVSTNNILHKYCSGEGGAIKARSHEFIFNKNAKELKFCDYNVGIHKCLNLNIDAEYRAYERIAGEDGDEDFREGPAPKKKRQENILPDTDDTVEEISIHLDCSTPHTLHKHNWISYIFYIIFTHNLVQYYPDDPEGNPTFFNTNKHRIFDFYKFNCINVLEDGNI